MIIRTLRILAVSACCLIATPLATADEIGGILFAPLFLDDDALGNPPENTRMRGVQINVLDMFLYYDAGDVADLHAAGFTVSLTIPWIAWEDEEQDWLIRVVDAVDKGVDLVHIEENIYHCVEDSGLCDGGDIVPAYWEMIYDAVKLANPNVLIGITEPIGNTLEDILDDLEGYPMPDFVAMEWYLNTGRVWAGQGGHLMSSWGDLDEFVDDMRDLGIKTGMWVGDYAGADTYPEKIAETAYKTDFVFFLGGPAWATSNGYGPALRDEIDLRTGNRVSVRNEMGDEVAFINDNGDVVLGGEESHGGSYSGSDPAFKILNASAVTKAAFENDGNLWLGDSVDQSESINDLNIRISGGDVTAIYDAAGDPVAVINSDGELAIRGNVFENAR